MKLFVNLPRNFNDYGHLCSVLNDTEFTELVTVDSKDCLVARYAKEYDKAHQPFKIMWNEFGEGSEKAQNKWGKDYNKKAPAQATDKALAYSDKVIHIDGGDGLVVKKAENEKKESVNETKCRTRRYQF